jgi:hypothetical protein
MRSPIGVLFDSTRAHYETQLAELNDRIRTVRACTAISFVFGIISISVASSRTSDPRDPLIWICVVGTISAWFGAVLSHQPRM